MSAPQHDEVPLGVECAWPVTRVHAPFGARLRLSLAITAFLLGAVGAARLGDTLWREARAWLTPALNALAPSYTQPDRGGERASRG
ncbi:MAG: hypothetical protein O2975_10120 [Proteobacteria bacterium]|nr:hypothetical protein [Pseudomonadota bacterium]